MTKLDPSMRTAIGWTVPIVVLALVLGAEFNWGRGTPLAPPPEAPQAPAPVSVAVLPEYTIAGGAGALVATSEHTLFNPTRHPAPPAVVASTSGGPSQMRRGQFILTGTAVYGDKAVAYLKETAGGKPRTVAKGETINGMLVAQVDSHGVRFRLGDETEDLPLKVAVGPKVTVQPAAPRTEAAGAGGGGAPVPAAMPRPGVREPNPAAAGAQPQTLGERRRAAREAQNARAQRSDAGTGNTKDASADPGASQGATDASANPPATGAAAAGDPRWQQMYQRIRNRGATQ